MTAKLTYLKRDPEQCMAALRRDRNDLMLVQHEIHHARLCSHHHKLPALYKRHERCAIMVWNGQINAAKALYAMAREQGAVNTSPFSDPLYASKLVFSREAWIDFVRWIP